MTPLFGLMVPDCNFDFRSVFRHVDMSGQGEFDLYADICSNVGRRVRERNVPEALLYGQNRTHGPLHGLLRLLGELIHLEIHDTTNNEIILDLVRGEVVVASPQRAKHDLSAGLLLRKLAHVIAEFDIVTILVSGKHVGPDTKENVVRGRYHMENVHTRLITLRATLVLVLVFGDLFGRELGVHIHELEDLGANLIKLGQLNGAQLLDVSVAPVLHVAVIHRLGLAKFVLHGADHILGNLAHVHCVVDVRVWRLAPLRDECVEVSLTINIG